MRYMIEDICMGIFLASALSFAVAILLYSIDGLWRLWVEQVDSASVQDAPSETRYSAEEEAWHIIRACFDGTKEEESSK